MTTLTLTEDETATYWETGELSEATLTRGEIEDCGLCWRARVVPFTDAYGSSLSVSAWTGRVHQCGSDPA